MVYPTIIPITVLPMSSYVKHNKSYFITNYMGNETTQIPTNYLQGKISKFRSIVYMSLGIDNFRKHYNYEIIDNKMHIHVFINTLV